MASISKRPDGRWRARYRDDGGKEHSAHRARKADAQRWLREQQTALDRGTWVDPSRGKVTFADYFAVWSGRQVWTSNTHKAMALAVRSTTFTDVELGKVRASHVEQWVKQMSATLMPSTIKTRFTNVRSVFKAAIRDQVIAVDPSVGVRLPRRRHKDAQMTIPTPQEVRRVLDVAPGRFRPFVALCAFAGLRLAEAAALQVDDVDFLRRTIGVRRQAQPAPGGGIEVRLPKYGSERDVYAADELLQMLALLVESGIHEPWLFAGGSNGPPATATVTERWRQSVAAAGLPGMKLHNLRHFYASGLIASGCDVVTVQRALGHASATTTLSTYSHLWPSAEDRTRAGATAIAREVLGDSADYLRTSEGS
jgi:integrase